MVKKWSRKDDEYLKNNYVKSNKDVLLKDLNRSWGSIQVRAYRLGIKRNSYFSNFGDGVQSSSRMWSQNELSFLVSNYETLDKDQLILKLNRSWSSIQNKTRCLNLKRDAANANTLNLANETNEAYYWLGFLIADGHFNSNKQLQVNLSTKDLLHLRKFASFVEYKYAINKPKINVSYASIDDWLSKFEIKNNKTYNPCKFNHLSGDKLFSFIIGFIDGDGCIDKQGYLTIKCHKSWIDNLNLMIRFLSGNDEYGGVINKQGLSLVTLTKIEIMKKIKKKINLLNLPILTRKWDRVNLLKLSKEEKNDIFKKQCFELFDKNILPKFVVGLTNLSSSFIYKIYKKYQLQKA